MWNNSPRELWNISLRSMWNEIRLFTFAKQIFHRGAISHGEAIFHSPKANFTEKSHSLARMAFFLAGAGGFEPATHGFGVAKNIHKVLKFLAFSPVSMSFSNKTMCRYCVWKFLMLFWCYEKIPPFIVVPARFWWSSALKFCVAENKEKTHWN